LPLIKTLFTIHLDCQVRADLGTDQAADTGLRIDDLGRIVTHPVELCGSLENLFLAVFNAETATLATVAANFDSKDLIFFTHQITLRGFANAETEPTQPKTGACGPQIGALIGTSSPFPNHKMFRTVPTPSRKPPSASGIELSGAFTKSG
jgi:hypothetical protein